MLAVLLLLSAVGLLIATFVTGQVSLAWGSVGISAVAGMFLLVRRRRLRRRPAEEPTDQDDAGPAQEDTDAADLPVVSELLDEVLVVDEHPRYHLAGCPWSDAAPAERLPVREARELGFTPCAQCSPDAALARRHRAESAT